VRNLSNSKGLPTNAIYGFTAMLFKAGALNVRNWSDWRS
jgi:5'-3' exonuclease